MNDLISRQAAIDICTSAIDLWSGQLGEGALVAVRNKIAELPSALGMNLADVGTDCISRQAAIDALDDDAEFLRRVLDDADIVGAERAKCEWGLGLIESYISDMKDLPSAQPQWIPCSERLPMTKDDYIITVKDKSLTWTDYVEWSADYHWWGYDDDMVIAWMPLPEPYKGEES